MSPSALRRGLLAALLSGSAALGLLTTAATPAYADTRDRVFLSQSGGIKTVLAPDRSAAGAPVRQVARIGVADATPPAQTWRSEQARQGGGAFTLVHTPTADAAGTRRLCLDVKGDSTTAAGAPLVLRPCDGTPSQAWKSLTNDVFTFMENQDSKLKVELVNGRLVQADFPPRDAPDANQRRTAQSVGVLPKTFGIGGI
jgi:hypothetical protein